MNEKELNARVGKLQQKITRMKADIKNRDRVNMERREQQRRDAKFKSLVKKKDLMLYYKVCDEMKKTYKS